MIRHHVLGSLAIVITVVGCGRQGSAPDEGARVSASSVRTEQDGDVTENGHFWRRVTYTGFLPSDDLQWGHRYGSPGPNGSWVIKAHPYDVATKDRGWRFANHFQWSHLLFGPYLSFHGLQAYYSVQFFLEISLSQASTTIRDGVERHAFQDINHAEDAFEADLSAWTPPKMHNDWIYSEFHKLSSLGLDWSDPAKRSKKRIVTIQTPIPYADVANVQFRIGRVHPVLSIVIEKVILTQNKVNR